MLDILDLLGILDQLVQLLDILDQLVVVGLMVLLATMDLLAIPVAKVKVRLHSLVRPLATQRWEIVGWTVLG